MIFTREILQQTEEFAALCAASKVGISPVRDQSVDDLVESVRQADTQLGSSLRAFLDGYRRWYEFHLNIETEGRAGRLTPEDSSTLADLRTALESARHQFINTLTRRA